MTHPPRLRTRVYPRETRKKICGVSFFYFPPPINPAHPPSRVFDSGNGHEDVRDPPSHSVSPRSEAARYLSEAGRVAGGEIFVSGDVDKTSYTRARRRWWWWWRW